MAESLLAHLYTHIKGSQEDIATWSLQYLISSSDELNRAFTKKVSEALCVKFDETLRYDAQVSEENIRPDMVGIDNNGVEMVFFEMKFYAALTENQPNKYLDMLIEKGGKGLLFVCPESRRITLWSKLCELCADRNVVGIANNCIKVDNINMALITWKEAVGCLSQVIADNTSKFYADIKQLEGYCNQIDSDAFIPFTDDDLKALTAIKEKRYYTVIKNVTELLLRDNSLVTERYRAQSNQYGFVSYIIANGYGLSLWYDRESWINKDSIDTPFWLGIDDDVTSKTDWKQSNELADKIRKKYARRKVEWNDVYIGLDVLTNATEDEVCMHIKNQIVKILNDIDKE